MSNTPLPHFRQIVRALRKKRGLTQEQLAEKTGSDYKHYQLIEIGKFPLPSLAMVAKLATALGTKPWVLICDDLAIVSLATGLTRQELEDAGTPAKGRPKKIGRFAHQFTPSDPQSVKVAIYRFQPDEDFEEFEALRSALNAAGGIEVIAYTHSDAEAVRILDELKPDILLLDPASLAPNRLDVRQHAREQKSQTKFVWLAFDDAERQAVHEQMMPDKVVLENNTEEILAAIREAMGKTKEQLGDVG